ncbi:MAG: YigZ family protein [Planctomycetes bacterium]|nr:YigZ family protein [Planctomycetota bacterium]
MTAEPRNFPAQEGYGEYEDRGSRFFAWVFPASDEAVFQARLEELKIEHVKARHHCWAWRLGSAYRFSDDGEPGGTAGRPMLRVLEGSGLHDLAAICVRYFGGVKLGTGGLARAYSGATARALAEVGCRAEVLRSALDLRLGFAEFGLRTEVEALFPGVVFLGDFDDLGWQGQIVAEASDMGRLCTFLLERGVELSKE